VADGGGDLIGEHLDLIVAGDLDIGEVYGPVVVE